MSWKPAHTANTTAPPARARSIAAADSRIRVAARTCGSSSPPPNRYTSSDVGDRRGRGDLHQLGGDAPAAAPLDEHDRVPAVAVGAEELGVHEPDAHGRLGRHRASRRVSAVNCVYDATTSTSVPPTRAAAAIGSGSTKQSTPS